jgi:peroxiredoxin
MAATPSTMLPLGTAAPDFRLTEPLTGKTVQLQDFQGASAMVIVFICNHCPFVIHLRDELIRFTKDYQDLGVQVIAINSNDVDRYPQDGPDLMAAEARQFGYPFPYLYDDSQEVAKAYGAACTPDFYLFDSGNFLVYRGQFDETRPGGSRPATGKDLREALDALLAGEPVDEEQKPSIGCNIKWKPGLEPEYFKL